MKIICPHCSHENSIDYAENIKCDKCHRSFRDFTYHIKKITAPLALSSLLLGGLITYKVENYIEQVRYPIRFEYAIISKCVASNHNGGYLSANEASRRIDICTCALEKTMNNIAFNKADTEIFVQQLGNNIAKCK